MKSQRIRVAVSVIVAGALFYSCSKKKEETSETAAAGGVTIEKLNMSTLPSFDSAVAAGTATALNLTAVVGTPPVFKSITSKNVADYFVGNVDTIIAAITTAKAASNWTEVQTQVDKFRKAQTKCRIAEGAARQISDFKSNTNSLCYMQNIDKDEATSLISVTSGATVAKGEFFKPGDTETLRKLEVGGMNDKSKEGKEGKLTGEGSGGMYIVFKIGGKDKYPNGYHIEMNMCDATTKKANGLEIIDWAGDTGLLSLTSYHKDTNGNFKATVKGFIEQENGNLKFSLTKERSMEMAGQFNGGGGSGSMVGAMKLSGVDIMTYMNMKNTFSYGGSSMTNSHQGVSKVAFTGTKPADIQILSGAGASKGSFTGPDGVARTFEDSAGFEYNSGESPKYATVTSSAYLTTVEAVDFTKDAVLSATVSNPDVSLISDAACTAAVATTGKMDMGSAGGVAVQTKCENDFSGGSDLCGTINNYERQIWDAVNAGKAAGKDMRGGKK